MDKNYIPPQLRGGRGRGGGEDAPGSLEISHFNRVTQRAKLPSGVRDQRRAWKPSASERIRVILGHSLPVGVASSTPLPLSPGVGPKPKMCTVKTGPLLVAAAAT